MHAGAQHEDVPSDEEGAGKKRLPQLEACVLCMQHKAKGLLKAGSDTTGPEASFSKC